MSNISYRVMTVYTYSSVSANPKDYINLPVMRNGKIVGIVSDAVLENLGGVKLTLSICDIGLEVMNEKPSAISIYSV